MLIIKGHLHPNILKSVWDLTEKLMNRLQSVSQYLVDTVFYGVTVTEIGDPNF